MREDCSFWVVTVRNLKGFFKCDMVILIKTKQKSASNPSHIFDKIFVLILHIETAVMLLSKFKYLYVFLEDL